MAASSQLDPEHAPSGGRLNYQNQFDSQGRITQIGGWSALTNDEHQWLQIKFSQIYQVSGVASQGSSDDTQWVTTYKLEYSTDGSTWIYYPQVRGLTHQISPYHINWELEQKRRRRLRKRRRRVHVFIFSSIG